MIQVQQTTTYLVANKFQNKLQEKAFQGSCIMHDRPATNQSA